MSEFTGSALSARASNFIREGVDDWIDEKFQSNKTTEKDKAKAIVQADARTWRAGVRVFPRKKNRGRELKYIEKRPGLRAGSFLQVNYIDLLAEKNIDIDHREQPPVIWITPGETGISKLLKDAEWITDLDDNWDDEGSLGYTEELLSKVGLLLKNWKNKSWKDSGELMPLPDVQPGPDGSIDLHWKKGTYELLLNVPNDDGLIHFYGDDYNENVMKGNFLQSAEMPNFLFWLYSVS